MLFSKIEIDRKSRIPLHIQIKTQIQEMIFKNLLHEEKKLPPTRKLAQNLKVNRSTVISAYNELLSESLVESHVGRGTFVSRRNLIEKKYFPIEPLHWPRYFAASSEIIRSSIIRETMPLFSQEEVISFAGGVPATELYPINNIKKIIHRLLERKGGEIFQLTHSEGYYPLRKMLANWMSLDGKSTNINEILIVSGSIQGLYLIAKKFLDPKDLVIVENPTFLGALQIFKSVGARIIGVPGDEMGMRIDILENILTREKPKFIYILPTFQNPSGTVLSLERRNKLLDLAYKYQVPIIEDDPYSKLYYEKMPPPSLKSLDRNNNVIYLSTFSKILFPGLRIGWLAGPKEVIERLTQSKHIIDINTNSIGQIVIYEFCKEGFLEKYLLQIQKAYAHKRDIMISALEKYCSSHMIWNKPGGGFYLWCKLNNGLSSIELLRDAFNEKVAFIVGKAFSPNGNKEDCLRLNFSYQNEELIEEGIQRLRKALRKLKKRSKVKIEKEDYFSKPIV